MGNNCRFQIPYDIICITCQNIIKEGRRLNTVKIKLEETYKTINIFKFIIKCPFCKNNFTIKTNPKIEEYEATENCVKKEVISNIYNDSSEEDILELEMSSYLISNTPIKVVKEAFKKDVSIQEINRRNFGKK